MEDFFKKGLRYKETFAAAYLEVYGKSPDMENTEDLFSLFLSGVQLGLQVGEEIALDNIDGIIEKFP